MVSIQGTIAEATARPGLGRTVPVQWRVWREPSGRASPPGAGAGRA
jgi:hypothetical protein